MADGLKYLIILALSWLTWRLLRPHTAFGRMRIPGKKLIAQVVAMRLAGNAIHRRGRRDNDHDDDTSDDTDDDTSGDQHDSPGASHGRGSERVVHTPAPPRTRFLPPERHEPAVGQGSGYPMVDAGTSPAAAGVSYRVAATSRRPPRTGELTAAPAGQDTQALGHTATPAGSASCEDSAAAPGVDAGGRAPAVVSTREQASTPAETTSSPPQAVGQQPRMHGLPAGRQPLQGRLLEDGTKLPERVNEANLTRDERGRVVFQVYRPEGSRFYAQEE